VKVRDLNKGEEIVLWEIHRNTIHTINSRDYSETQVEAWAPAEFDSEMWQNKILSICPFVVEENGQIIGYSDLQPSGLIDHFFVHHQFQRQGVGTLLMHEIERRAKENQVALLEAHVSITARPFFEVFQFHILSEQDVEVRGETIRNYIMRRQLSCT